MLACACVVPRPHWGAHIHLRRPAFAAPQSTKAAASNAFHSRPTLTIVRAHGADCAVCDAGASTTTAAAKPTAKSTSCIFDAVGGAEGVRAAVDIFYQKVLSDPEVSHYFDGVDMAKQKSKQMAFMTFVFGGPAAYRGRDMGTAHQHLQGLSHHHFDAIKGHFAQTLIELGVAQETIEGAAAVVESTRNEFNLLDN